MKYDEFIEGKQRSDNTCGFEVDEVNPMLFDFQKDIVIWALKMGKSAIFADCGLGKTPMQLEWAHKVNLHTGKPVLILAPLAVSRQTIGEGVKFGIDVQKYTDGNCGILISNYEQLHNIDLSLFAGIVLDESSILKSYSGKIRNDIIEKTKDMKFKLACTATPAPNDFMELGNHAEFLNIMTRSQMLSMFFINDTAHTGTWRLKGHAEKKYWKWLTEWAVMIRKPSDLGYEDNGFLLPPIKIHEHIIDAKPLDGELFATVASTLQERQKARRETVSERSKLAADIVNNTDGLFLIWCNLNTESQELKRSIENAVEITGSDTDKHKEDSMTNFSKSKIQRLVTKPKIAGFGMNWQNCHNTIFVGLSDSYEQYYQAVRRTWRFGQKEQVNIHIVISENEGSVLQNIRRKEKDADNMAREMVKNMKDLSSAIIHDHSEDIKKEYQSTVHEDKRFTAILGDSIKEIKTVKENSIHFSIFSPPFSSLFTYSDSEMDMGNSKDDGEFWKHFGYLIPDIYRIMMPGRLVAIHAMNLLATIGHDGYMGVKDFRGDIIRNFQKNGFIYHSEVLIWKDPLLQAVRTKVLSLAHKQISKDASRCAQGLPDYLIIMRKPGENTEPVAKGRGFEKYIGELDEPVAQKTNEARTNKYSHLVWQRYASPVWMDIRQTNTLNTVMAKDNKDERHICPLQLDVIERAVELWTNENDIVFSPFMGIGSEGYSALKQNRRFIGIELKESYYNEAVKNMREAQTIKQTSMF